VIEFGLVIDRDEVRFENALHPIRVTHRARTLSLMVWASKISPSTYHWKTLTDLYAFSAVVVSPP
jgi:hypothetical protein